MLKNIFALFFVLLLAGCGSAGGKKVTDFSELSVGYGWLDVSGVDANTLDSVVIFQHRPLSETPYYHVAVEKFESGFLYYSFAFPKGSFAAYSAEGQSCLGIICSNTIYTYRFGKQGDDVAAVSIDQPGVYHFGDYALEEIKTGLFEQDKFKAVPAKSAPTKKQMLKEILVSAQDVPIVAQRIKAELEKLQ